MAIFLHLKLIHGAIISFNISQAVVKLKLWLSGGGGGGGGFTAFRYHNERLRIVIKYN